MENNQIKNTDHYTKWDDIAKTKLLKWGCSWGVIVLAILFTGTAIFSLIDFINTLENGVLSIIIATIPLILNVLCSVGAWQIVIYSLKKQVNPCGAKLIRGVWQLYKSIAILLLVLIDLILIIIIAIGAKFITEIGDSAGNLAGIVSSDLQDTIGSITSTGTGLLIAILIVFVILTILFIVFMSRVTRFANAVCETMLHCKVTKVSTLGASVFLFIVGGIIIISAFTLGNDAIGIIRIMLSSFSFIFLGILALQFSALYDKVELDYRVLNPNNSK